MGYFPDSLANTEFLGNNQSRALVAFRNRYGEVNSTVFRGGSLRSKSTESR